MSAALPAEFWSKVEKTETCWLWMGARNQFGYGVFRLNGVLQSAHRLAISATRGRYVDHLCYVRNCVNPDHLQIVTNRENVENRSGANANSSTGVRGVFWDRARGKYRVEVKSKYKSHYGGRYETLAEAETAAIALRNALMTNNLLDRVSA